MNSRIRFQGSAIESGYGENTECIADIPDNNLSAEGRKEDESYESVLSLVRTRRVTVADTGKRVRIQAAQSEISPLLNRDSGWTYR